MDVGIFFSILFGIVEGLTEFIPISSTAHILLTARYLELTPTPFFTAFTVCIQSGAILAGIIYFWKTLWTNKTLIPKILLALIPTIVIGLLFHNTITGLFSNVAIIGWALIIGGILLILLQPNDAPEIAHTLSYKHAFLIGLSQVFSFIPGVSRAGATLIGGTLLGIPRSQIVPFSFLLGIPTIIGASIVEIKTFPSFEPYEWRFIAIGILVSGIIAYLTIGFFVTLLTKKPLSWFGWYRIVIGIIALLFLS